MSKVSGAPALSLFPPVCWCRAGASRLLFPVFECARALQEVDKLGTAHRHLFCTGEARGPHCKCGFWVCTDTAALDGESSEWYTRALPFPPFCVGRVGASSVLSPLCLGVPFHCRKWTIWALLQGSADTAARYGESSDW